MKSLAIIGAVVMAVFTAVSIAFAPEWAYRTVLYLGPFDISTFDFMFFLAVGLLVADNAMGMRPERVPANRLVLGLCWAYLGYQLFIVMPAAVLLYGLRVIDVFRLQEVRLSLILVPVTYGLILRYLKPAVLVSIVDAAAAVLAVWVLYRYIASPDQGYVVEGVFRLRAAWTGAVLLFGWLFLTSMFYRPMRVWSLALATLAVAGLGVANYRSGILAFVAGLAAVLVTMRGVSRRVLIALAIVVVLGLGVSLGASSTRESIGYSLATVLDASSDHTAQDRVTRSKLGLEYFEQHPLGDYVWSRTYYLVNAGWNFVPHNFVVQLLVTQGAIASGLFFAIIGVTLWIAWKNRGDRLSALMASYLVFYLTFCLFNPNIDNRENVALFCISVALVLDANRNRTPLEDSARQPGAGCPESTTATGIATVWSADEDESAQQASDCSPIPPRRREAGKG